MSWKDVRTYRSRESVEHEVNGKAVRFYPNRIRLLPELTALSLPVAKAMAELLDPSRSDASMSEKTMQEGATVIRESTVQVTPPDVIKARAAARDAALEALLVAAGDDRNRLRLGRLLMDSMAEDFPYAADRSPADVEAFLYGSDGVEGIDIPILSQLVAGWIKANAKQFSKVGELVAARLGDRLGGMGAPSPSTPPSPSAGSSSRTPSSPPSQAASS